MALSNDLNNAVDDFFSGEYDITNGTVIPDVEDIKFGKNGKEIELAMMFIDIRESTKIVDGFHRTTAAKMYKSFLWGVAKIARANGGELRSFNGDGVLIAFIGDTKRTNSVVSALNMAWFILNCLKPKLEGYFKNNQKLQDLEFKFGIGIDCGKVLVVRGGIRGDNNNDLVWVGNATNFAVKLSALSKDVYHTYISKDVYEKMSDKAKLTLKTKENMWEKRIWNDMNDMEVYRTDWNRKP